VVNPRTSLLVCSSAPAPRKPTPVTIPAATRAVSCAEPCRGKASIERIVNRHELMEITILVRRPAGWPVQSRSKPTTAPNKAARAIFPADSHPRDCKLRSQSALCSTLTPHSRYTHKPHLRPAASHHHERMTPISRCAGRHLLPIHTKRRRAPQRTAGSALAVPADITTPGTMLGCYSGRT
jgi:hypothetical protein